MNNSYTRFHRDRWYGTGYQRYESNEEAQLDFRFTVGGGLGRYVIQTNRTQLGLLAGLAGNREHECRQHESHDLDHELGLTLR